VQMALSTRSTVLSLYIRVFRIAQTGAVSDSAAERRYIEQEARSLFRQNQQLTDPESIRRCIEECEARIEILHYRNPYPRAAYLPPLGLATQRGRRLRAQQRLRKQAKPVYLQSHDDT
uniref:LYR motif containing 1 n=1 Tax=Poecilia reticulata TaxID=8081 RepID=A0A3P9PV41_POERE